MIMLRKILFGGKEIPLEEIKLEWSDCFGELHTGSIEEYASDYAAEQVGISEAGEGW